jgi:integrase
MRREHGTIEKRNGRFRARARAGSERPTLGSFATEEEAVAALALFAEKYRETVPVAGPTVRSWGRTYLDHRELGGVYRAVQKDRYVWRRVDAAPFADLPLAAVTTRDIRDWVGAQLRTKSERTGKTPGRQTVVNALNLLRVALGHACHSGVLEQNPANGVRVPRVARTKEAWTWLRTEEITKLLGENVDVGPRCLFAFAIFTGLRAGEIFGLKWTDIDSTRNVAAICRSWQGAPTKRGETREVHLFEAAIEALKTQRARNLKGPWVFPNERGEPRSKNHKPDLDLWLEKAGVKRHVRFHDLRHTCASHLVSGSWGRAWTLEEVSKHLGHSSSAVTRRYAHLCPEGLARAVRETRPELQMKLLHCPKSPVPNAGPKWSQAAGAEFSDDDGKRLNLAEEKGFEPLVELPPRRFSKPLP